MTALVRGTLRPIAPSAFRTTRYLLIETGPAARVEETRFVPQGVDGEATPSRVTLPLRFIFPEEQAPRVPSRLR